MNTKFKLIAILLMTLVVLGGGVLFYADQLFDGEKNGRGIFFQLFEESDAFLDNQSVIPGARADQLDSYKPSSFSRSMNLASDNSSIGIDISGVSTSSNMKSASQLGGSNAGVAYRSSADKEKLYSSGSRAGDKNDLFAFGSRRGGGSEVSSTGGGASGAVVGSTLFAPAIGGGTTNDWVLIDPEAYTGDELNPDDQIVPVGTGAYILSVLSLLYGLFIFIRRR